MTLCHRSNEIIQITIKWQRILSKNSHTFGDNSREIDSTKAWLEQTCQPKLQRLHTIKPGLA
jgi:hypothetical protein